MNIKRNLVKKVILHLLALSILIFESTLIVAATCNNPQNVISNCNSITTSSGGGVPQNYEYECNTSWSYGGSGTNESMQCVWNDSTNQCWNGHACTAPAGIE